MNEHNSEKTPMQNAEPFGLYLVDPYGNRIHIESLPAIIGCDEDSQIRLEHPSVARRHAILNYQSSLGAVVIEDLGSDSGISVNGLPTYKNLLQDQDKIQLGDVVLLFRDTGYIHPESK